MINNQNTTSTKKIPPMNFMGCSDLGRATLLEINSLTGVISPEEVYKSNSTEPIQSYQVIVSNDFFGECNENYHMITTTLMMGCTGDQIIEEENNQFKKVHINLFSSGITKNLLYIKEK